MVTVLRCVDERSQVGERPFRHDDGARPSRSPLGGGFAWTSVGARCTIRRIVDLHGYFWPNPSGDLVGRVGDPLGYCAGLGLKHPHRVWTRDKHCGST
jgi:hypothetical protein